jgi:hypothetical protein
VSCGKVTTDLSNTLYPDLVDHELVTQYPSVVGMAKNLFFMWVNTTWRQADLSRHHTNPEKGGGDNGSSKSNPFEVSHNRIRLISGGHGL